MRLPSSSASASRALPLTALTPARSASCLCSSAKLAELTDFDCCSCKVFELTLWQPHRAVRRPSLRPDSRERAVQSTTAVVQRSASCRCANAWLDQLAGVCQQQWIGAQCTSLVTRLGRRASKNSQNSVIMSNSTTTAPRRQRSRCWWSAAGIMMLLLFSLTTHLGCAMQNKKCCPSLKVVQQLRQRSA